MTRSVPEATIAVGRIRAMPFGRARTEAAARQVRLIESEGPDEVRAYALESLVEALTWTGEPDQALKPFVRLLRWWDAHPELFDDGDQNILFWEFGWIVNDMCRNPAISVERVERTLDDMERRFSVANRGIERVWSCRLEWELLRDGPGLATTFTTWLTLPIDDEDSCLACHEEHRAEYLLQTGDLTGAVAVVDAALTAGLSCSREPAALLAMEAWCQLELGHLDEVARVAPQALAEVRGAAATAVVVAYSRLFEVFARCGNLHRAGGLLPEIAAGMRSATAYIRLEALRHLVAGTQALILLGFGDEAVDVTGWDVSTVTGLAGAVGLQARELTEAFDRRHGTGVQARRLERARMSRPSPYPLEAELVEPAVTATVVPALAGSGPVAAGTTTIQRAEAAFRSGDHPRAAALFRKAAGEAEIDGRLSQAGWCWAEAARNAQEIGQLITAAHDYVEALSRLKAAGTSLEEIARLFVAWAPAVEASGYRTFVRLAQQDYPTPAHIGCTEKIEEVMPEVLDASMVSSPLIRRYVLARAELRDALARVMATWGDADDHESALRMAEESATRFSTLGRTEAAAHAWWLAGRVAARLQDQSVDANFTMALQGFRSTGERNRGYGLSAANDYARYLADTGQPDQAHAVLAGWAEKD